MRRFLLMVLGLFVFAGVAFADVPKLQSHVNDYASLMSEEQRATLDAKLLAFEQSQPSHPQLVFLTVKELPSGESVEAFANEVFQAWKLGQKGVDNGVLVVLSMSPRKVRVEVGRGLEGDITDTQSSMVIDHMKPYLRTAHFYNAFDAATDTLISAIVKGIQPAESEKSGGDDGSAWPLIVLVILIVGGGYIIYRSANQKSDSTRDDADTAAAGAAALGAGVAASAAFSRRSNSSPSKTTAKRKLFSRSDSSSNTNSGLLGAIVGSSISDYGSRSSSSSGSSSTSSWGGGGGGGSDGGGASGDW